MPANHLNLFDMTDPHSNLSWVNRLRPRILFVGYGFFIYGFSQA
jgi:hypothetical protein